MNDFPKKDKFIILEPLLIYITFFAQSIFVTSTDAGDTFSSAQFPYIMFLSIITQVPHIILIIYIMHLKNDVSLSRFGIVKPKGKNILYALGFFIGLLIIYNIAITLYVALGFSIENDGITEVNLGKSINIPLILLFCLTTGYREELFFRSYLLIRFKQWGIKPWAAILTSALLFSILHLYQGISGLYFTTIAGIYFAIIFMKTQNLHVIAISHGLFNFTMLMMSNFVNASLPG